MKIVGIVAKKVGMTRMVDKSGNFIPVTLVQIPTQKVTKLITKETQGYAAVQIAYAEKSEKNLLKSEITQLRKAGVNENFSELCEFRIPQKGKTEAKAEEYAAIGDALNVSLFDGIKFVDATGITKGRGFTGSVKKWGTACGRMTHGSRFHRRPGSLGTRTTPGRVFKGKPQHGHYGDEKVTIQNLQIMDIDSKNSTIALKGSIPGHRNGFIFLRPTVK